MVILAVGLVPAQGTKELTRMLRVDTDADGWLSELDYNSDPTDTERGGVYVAGMCQGPKDIPDTVAQASAVAAAALEAWPPAAVSTAAPISPSATSRRAPRASSGCSHRRHTCGDEPHRPARGESMAIRANPKLIDELAIYGAQDVSKCYHCGNCSATCPFSKDPYILPRRSMRSLQMGLEKKLEGDLEPWLCYYCGECSKTARETPSPARR